MSAQTEARDRSMRVTRDESDGSETPCTDAATYSRIAARKFDAVDGEERGDPALAYRSLWDARRFLQYALAQAERELERFGFDHGFEGSPFAPSPAAITTDCQDNASERRQAYAADVVASLEAAE